MTSRVEPGGTSLQNYANADAIAEAVQRMVEFGIPPSSITILTIYKSQTFIIVSKLEDKYASVVSGTWNIRHSDLRRSRNDVLTGVMLSEIWTNKTSSNWPKSCLYEIADLNPSRLTTLLSNVSRKRGSWQRDSKTTRSCSKSTCVGRKNYFDEIETQLPLLPQNDMPETFVKLSENWDRRGVYYRI